MRIDPKDTSIHDLTPKEAADLRDLCERMLKGPVALDHPLFVQWAEDFMPGSIEKGRGSLLTTAFLPRALHALLVRAEKKIASAKSGALGEPI
jgi:hypothetical protein